MRANTQNAQQGEQETRGAGEGRKKSVEQRREEICGRERDGAGYTGKQDGHYRAFRKESREFEGGEFGVDSWG